jgi:hypothetical protein
MYVVKGSTLKLLKLHYKKYVDSRPSIFVTRSSRFFIYDDSMTKNRSSKTERQESTTTTFNLKSS